VFTDFNSAILFSFYPIYQSVPSQKTGVEYEPPPPKPPPPPAPTSFPPNNPKGLSSKSITNALAPLSPPLAIKASTVVEVCVKVLLIVTLQVPKALEVPILIVVEFEPAPDILLLAILICLKPVEEPDNAISTLFVVPVFVPVANAIL
jgi:hypothetical protein